MTNKYEIILYWDKEDDCFVAEVPELPGCAAHGATEEEALKQVKTAISLWIETALANNDPVPAPKDRKLMSAG